MITERISSYDLDSNLREHLLSLWSKTKAYTDAFSYMEEDLSDARVCYMRNLHDLHVGIDEGLSVLEKMQKYKVKETTVLRKNALHYHKRYYKDTKLRRIESYLSGRLDVVFVAAYLDGGRYLFPFLRDGNHYPTYTHVLENHSDVTEEYLCDRGQIVYSRYEKTADHRYAYSQVNYVPDGQYPILGYETGVFLVTETISYRMEQQYTWYHEFQAKQKGLPFPDPAIDGILRITNSDLLPASARRTP